MLRYPLRCGKMAKQYSWKGDFKYPVPIPFETLHLLKW